MDVRKPRLVITMEWGKGELTWNITFIINFHGFKLERVSPLRRFMQLSLLGVDSERFCVKTQMTLSFSPFFPLWCGMNWVMPHFSVY